MDSSKPTLLECAIILVAGALLLCVVVGLVAVVRLPKTLAMTSAQVLPPAAPVPPRPTPTPRVGFRSPEDGSPKAPQLDWVLLSAERRETLTDRDNRYRSDEEFTHLVLRFAITNRGDERVFPAVEDVGIVYRQTPEQAPVHKNPDTRLTSTAYYQLGSPARLTTLSTLGAFLGVPLHIDETKEFLAVWKVPRNPATLEWSVAGSAAPRDVLPQWQAAVIVP